MGLGIKEFEKLPFAKAQGGSDFPNRPAVLQKHKNRRPTVLQP